MKNFCLMVVALTSLSAYGQEDKYLYCEIEGMARGNNSDFIAQIANKYVEKKGLALDDICFQVKKASFDFIRNKMHSGKGVSKKDLERFTKYTEFEDEVLNAVMRNMNR